jgi:glycerol-3-phosphate acyltransferase PlsY
VDIIYLIAAIVSVALVAYLLGSINFAIIITKIFAKKDIRDFGSGNAGMTNVLRTLGKGPAALTLVGDFSKGIVAVLLGKLIFSFIGGTEGILFGGYISAFFVMLGHLFPLYYKFKGGKGILVCAGAILIIDPLVLAIVLSIFIIFVVISRYVSLGSIAAAVSFPIATFCLALIRQSNTIFQDSFMALTIAAIIIFMHRGNIKRLLNGTESRLGKKKQEASSDKNS